MKRHTLQLDALSECLRGDIKTAKASVSLLMPAERRHLYLNALVLAGLCEDVRKENEAPRIAAIEHAERAGG